MKPTYEQLESELAATKAALAKTNQLLREALDRIADLEEKLNLNSKNISKPPSTDLMVFNPRTEGASLKSLFQQVINPES